MSIRLLSKDFAFYGTLDFLQRSLSIILVPIYTRVLTQSSYGNLDLVLTACSVLTVLVDLQFVAGFSRLYLERRRGGDGPRLVGTSLLTAMALGTAVAATFLALGYSGLLEVKFLPSFLQHRTAWTLAVAVIPVSFAFDLFLMQSQLLRWKKWFFAGALSNTVLLTALSIVFTVVIPLGITGVLLGQFLGKVIATAILFAGMRREVSFHFVGRILREVGAYTLPLVPGRWVSHSSAYVSRFFIYGALGASENAILAIATKIAAVLDFFCIAFRNAWLPLAMSYIGDDRGEQFYVRSLRVFLAGGIFSIFFLTAVSRPILTILAPESYGAAQNFVPLFLAAAIVAELDVNLQLGNQISRKTYWISIASAAAFAINLLVLSVLTSRLGIYAAGCGLLAAFLFKVLITYKSAQRNYKIRYDKRSLFVFASSCCALVALSLLKAGSHLSELSYVGSAAGLAVVLPWLALNSEDRHLIRIWGGDSWRWILRRRAELFS